MTMLLEGERSLRDMHCGRARTLLLAIVLAVAAPAFAGSAAKNVPLESAWLDARNGYRNDDDSSRWSDDGGRTWHRVFSAGRASSVFRTSRSAAIASISTGCCGEPGQQSFAWTNDGGKHWYNGGLPMSQVAGFAGRGELLFWHDGRDTLYRVEGWPPRGPLPCVEVSTEGWAWLPPGEKLCEDEPAGMRSVVAARVDRGVFRLELRVVPGGVAAFVNDSPHWEPRVAVYRSESMSVAELPEPYFYSEDERAAPGRLVVAWPSLYAVSDLILDHPSRRIVLGTVLWRSADGGKTWTVTVARTPSSRAYRVHARARIVSRTWLPGGYVASARVGARLALVIRQLDHTRPLLALPGSAKCSALELRVDWPNILVEGRRGGSTRAIWLSQNGGYRWTRFAVHGRTRSGSC